MTSQIGIHSSETAGGTTGRTMKAIVQEGSGSADVLKLREIERPVAAEGRVLVRVRADRKSVV